MPTNDHSQSPNAEEKDTDPRPPVLPKNKIQKGTNKRALESSDDDDPSQAPSHSLPVQPQKKVRLGTGTQKKKHNSPNDAAINDHSEDKKTPTSQSKKSKSKKTASNENGDSDSELEIIENPQESPEKELGM